MIGTVAAGAGAELIPAHTCDYYFIRLLIFITLYSVCERGMWVSALLLCAVDACAESKHLHVNPAVPA